MLHYALLCKYICISALTRICKTGCGNKIIPVPLSLQDKVLGIELLTNGFKITQMEEGRYAVLIVRLATENFL